ncbi:MAG: hypothetical protein Kow0058_08870 [Roseovarius sp.]
MGVAHIAKAPDHAKDTLNRRLAHTGAAVEHAIYRREADLRFSGDVPDRRPVQWRLPCRKHRSAA